METKRLSMELKDFEDGLKHVFTRKDAFMGERECTVQADDPAFDMTDFAHPAWMRGVEHATNRVVEMLTKALDGKDGGKGSVSHEGLNKLRERLRALSKTQPEWLSQALNEGDGTYKP